MPVPLPLPDLPPGTLLRSGTAARLAGLPATTLRVWERRYGVVAGPKTPTGQRLYAVSDVRRLALLRQLTGTGHAIGTIAALPLEALQGLAAVAPPSPSGGAQTMTVFVVGASIAPRLAATPWAAALRPCEDLEAARAALAAAGDDRARHLLVELPALTPALAGAVADLAADRRAGVSVVYRFGATAAVGRLRAAGVAVLREPAGQRALVRRLDAACRVAAALPATADPAAGEVIPPRRFTDGELATLAALPSTVLCECPRHLAEIVAQLAGFERYSAECGSANPADEALHRRLHALAAQSRAHFEQALADVAAAEGHLPPG